MSTVVRRIQVCLVVLTLLSAAVAGAARAADPAADAAWIDTVEQRIAAEEYHVTWQEQTGLPGLDAAYHAPNRGQGLRTYFAGTGIRVVPRAASPDTLPAWEWSLSLVGYGAGGRSWRVPEADLAPQDNRIEYRRGALTEWYVNEPRGLKQGFTLPAPPDELARGEALDALDAESLVHLDLELSGDLRPSFAADGRSIDFMTASGAHAVHYAELVVTDATGRELESWMEGVVEPVRGIRIVFDASDAVYPVTVDPLATSPAWTAESDQAGSDFGFFVATAGDVNGDGYSDVIVTAQTYDNGETDEGRAFVYLGSAAGPGATAAWTAESDQAGARFGWSVSTAGDVNGDGYSDVIVGARFYTNGQTSEGRAYVYLGSAAGLQATAAWTAESNQIGAECHSVATAGDVNGDGYSDVIVGATRYDNGQGDEGRAFVYLGSASGLAATAAWTAESDQALALFGRSVSTAGDVNGDGYSDVIVGAYLYDNGQTNEGRAYLYHGSASGLAAAAAWTAESDQAEANFSYSVATAGDVNGDGYSDVIVGGSGYDNVETDEGRAFVYFGSAAGLQATAAWTAESDQAGALFGTSVGTAGDVNGDGYSDLIAGAHLYDNVETDEGRAFVYFGSAAGPAATAAWTAESDQASARFGEFVATAGDVNGDGYSDVIVGARHYDNGETDEGRAFVYLGSAAGPAATAAWTAESDQAGAVFGFSVSTAGDVNGDGYSDVIVGAIQYDNGQTDEGRAWVYLGSAAGPGATAAWTAESNQAFAQFGWSVSTAGDVNGDGYSDVIVGASNYDNGQSNEGRAFVYLGSASGLQATAAWTAESDQASALFGVSVSTAGDVNGDGYSDVIVGAIQYDNGQIDEGRAWVYLGSAAGPGATAAWTAESDQVGAQFGFSVSTAGDVNGDGYSDVIVGAQQYDNGQLDEGRAWVYLGSAAGPGATAAWTAESDQGAASFGGSVATAGDVNGDGYSDVIVGASGYDDALDEGRAYVYLGSAAGPGATAAWTAETDQAIAHFGFSVSTAGDVNGDGYSDVIVAASNYGNGQGNEGRAFVYLGSASGPGATAAWTAESNQVGAQFGWSVSTAGDVNGDGYSDVIVGAYLYDNGELDEGRAYVYYGNSGGLSVTPQQRRVGDAAPIVPGGWSDELDSVRLAAIGRTPFGRAPVRLQWEVEPLGSLFDGAGTGASASPTDSGLGGAAFDELVTGLTTGTSYHWRVRTLYDPAATPFQPAGRWFTIPRGGWNETLFTTNVEADLSLTQTDAADPVTDTQSITYTLTVANAGPGASSVVVTDLLPGGSSFVSATPSQGSCNESSGTLTCALGAIASGGGATIAVVVDPSAPGLYTNSASVAGSAVDTNPANDDDAETTTVVASTLGGRVWNDWDGDGIQDPGEPPVGGVLVELLDGGTGSPVNLDVTASDGSYFFAPLPSPTHRLRFSAPPGWVWTMSNQGGNDALDSDANPVTGETASIGPVFTPEDATRWDAGLRQLGACFTPDEEVYIYDVRLSTDGNNYTILDFQDPNQPSEVTGYNVYRSSDAGLDPALWPLVASNVIDMDQATPNKQWTDQSNDVSPSGIWYYEIAPYNGVCNAEGPW